MIFPFQSRSCRACNELGFSREMYSSLRCYYDYLDSNLHAVFTFNECYDIRSVDERIVMYFGGKIDKNEKNGIKDMNLCTFTCSCRFYYTII